MGESPDDVTKTQFLSMELPSDVKRAVREEDLGPLWARKRILFAGRGVEPEDGLEPERRPLLEHQKTALADLHAWWGSPERNGVLCLPTGAGKTRTGVTFALREALSHGSVLWLAHREELVAQAVAAFARCSEEAEGLVRIGRFEAGARKAAEHVDVLVASIPTLAADEQNLERVFSQQGNDFALVVVDECHHGVARTWRHVIETALARCPRAKLLGLSATPIRSAGREELALRDLFGRIVHEASVLELIGRGVLAQPKFVVVDTHLAFEATREDREGFELFGELPESLVDRLARDTERNTQIFKTYLAEPGRWGPTLFFTANLHQARTFTEAFHANHYPVDVLRGDMPSAERRRVLSQFKAGNLFALVNVGVLTEGTDIPGVRTVFLARPTRSRVLFQQIVGRAMRGPLAGGNSECNVVIFADVITGLAAQAYSTTFKNEREAREVILGADRAPADTPPRERAPRPEATHAPLADDLSGAAAPHLEAKLLGWWEVATTEREPTRLPVFAVDAALVDAWMRILARGERLLAPTGVRFTPADRFEEFADAYLLRRTTPFRFVPIESVPEPARTEIALSLGGKPSPVGDNTAPGVATTSAEQATTVPFIERRREARASEADVELIQDGVAVDESRDDLDPLVLVAEMVVALPPSKRGAALAAIYPRFRRQFATYPDFAKAVRALAEGPPSAPVSDLRPDDVLVLKALTRSQSGLTKSEVLRATRVTAKAWAGTIRRLVERGHVSLVGKRRGSRYFLTPEGMRALDAHR